MKSAPTFKDVENAYSHLKPLIFQTPVWPSEVFSHESGNTVYMKAENLQKTGSFKLRGASYKISRLSEIQRRKGLIASSAGNHAQGVALAASLLKSKSTIVMPRTTPFIKVEATKRLGADVVLHGTCYDEAYAHAQKIMSKTGAIFIHPFDDKDVIAGQGTLSIEILKEHPDVDIFLVPIGGGGLIAGMAMAAKKINPKVKIYGVEPSGACAMALSLKNKFPFQLDSINTVADGVAVKSPGHLTFQMISKYVDDILIVDDHDIMEAFLMLMERHKIIAEAAGVLALAGLKKLKAKNKKVVSTITGGNIDVVGVSSMINKGLISRGRVCCFSVDLPDTPGELLKVSQLLYNTQANVIQLDHNQFKTPNRFNRVILEVTIEANGHKHLNQILNALIQNGYAIRKIV